MNRLWNIGWGTVSACNMKCRFCYSRSKRNPAKDLTLKDWIFFIANNWEKINSINYGTGENSLTDDWFTLIQYIRKNHPHILQAVTTNGYIGHIINKDLKKRQIVLASIDEMDISIDFANSEMHNRFRGQPDAFDWAIETLDFCHRNNKSSTIVSLGSSLNAYPDNLEGIFEIAKKFDSIVRMNLYRPTEGVDDFSRQFILSPNKLVDLLRWINKEHTILSISDALFSNLLTDQFESDPSGINSLRILPDGSVSPSTYLIHSEYIVGNISEPNVLNRLENNEQLNTIMREVIPEECAGCRYVEKCKGGVYDRRYLWNSTLDRKDPYCQYNPGEPEWEKLTISKQAFQSVHHGYLPTMFFKP